MKVYKSYGLPTSQEDLTLQDRTPAWLAMFILTGPVSPAVGVDDPAAEDR